MRESFPHLTAALLLASSSIALSQTVPECYVDFDDIAVTVSLDSIPLPGRTTAKFELMMPYDSSWVRYSWCEVFRNQERLPLVSWCRRRQIRAETMQLMNDSTRTAPFVVNTGDTISFTRIFSWGMRRGDSSMGQSAQRFYSRDTLDFVVELVSSSTQSRLALIDSFGVLRRIPSGPPTLYGQHPIACNISYVVGSPLDGDTVVLRLRTDARGDGQWALCREDGLSFAVSKQFSDSAWINYNVSMGAPLARLVGPVVARWPRVDRSAATMTLRADGTNGAFICEVAAPEELSPVTLSVYDGTGRLLWSPAIWPYGIPGGRARVPISVQSSMVRFVVLTSRSRILAAERVTIE